LKFSVGENKPLVETLVVHHDGVSVLTSMRIYHSACTIHMQNFPFDVQNCTLKFCSWAYASDKLALEFKDKNADKTISFQWYTENSEWNITASGARRNVNENLPGFSDWYDLTVLHFVTIYCGANRCMEI
jgi:Neurotransmitter-gated ion-channel ligand binding domain